MSEKIIRLISEKLKIYASIFCCLFIGIGMLSCPINVEAATVPQIKYQSHVQNDGWKPIVSSGKTSGTTGASKRQEAIKIFLAQKNTSMISYRVHVADIGWQGWKNSGQIAGTTGKSKAIEAIQIKLKGNYEKKYDIYYRVHVAHYGWLGWAKNGEVAGSTGIALRTEAIQIQLVKKNSQFSIGGRKTLTKPSLTYKAHSESNGWMNYVKENSVAGTTGKARRLEALIINFKNFSNKSGIVYRAHVADIGWQGWKNSGQTAGTTGKSKAIEAVQIKLTSDMEAYFDVYYRLHVANYGWLGWAKNGATAGSTGIALRAEAIQIKIVNKGAAIDTGGAATVNRPSSSGSANLSDRNNRILKNLQNDTSLRLSNEKRMAMVAAARRLLGDNYEPEFVAGVLGNIMYEGTIGKFESSNYRDPSKEPAYLKYMDSHFSYRSAFSNKTIFEVGINAAVNLQRKAQESGIGKFGFGMIQWTGSRTEGVLRSYVKYSNGNNVPTREQAATAEVNFMIEELRSNSYSYIYNGWKNGNKTAANAASRICLYYERPADKERMAAVRANAASKIYTVMMR